MPQINHLKQKLANKQSVIGTWGTIPSPVLSEVIASTGIDFFIIDREHASISFETAANMIISCENRNVSPLIRLADLSLSEVQRALDLGAHGIHVANVEHPDQLDTLVRFAKYPPQGSRGFSPFTRISQYGSSDPQKHLQTINDFPLLVVHLEGISALKYLDLFIAHPHVDVLFLGLYDLSKSLGMPGAVDHPEILHLLKESSHKIRKAGKTVGTIATTPRQLEEFLDYGINYITYSIDCRMLIHSYTSILEMFREKQTDKTLKTSKSPA